MSQAMCKLRQLLLEVVVGGFMFAVLIGLGTFTIVLSRDTWWSKGKVPFEVVFEHVMGLRDGDNVVVRGMEIGKVKKLILMNDGVHVVCSLKTNIILKTDYKIEVIPTSVLGGRYLQITEGTNAEALPAGIVPKGKTPIDVMALVSEVAADIKKITGNISEGRGTVGKLINDDSLYMDMQNIVSNLKYAVSERGLLKNVEEAVSNLNQITWKINSGEGTLGKLVNDPSLYDEAKKAVTDVRNTLDDVRETSPIVTFASIFFGAF